MIIIQASQSKERIASKGSGMRSIGDRIRYAARTKDLQSEGLSPVYTNCASVTNEGIIAEMEALGSRKPRLKKLTDHVIFSPEVGDRLLSQEEWQKAIGAYREERGLGDAPFAAYLHTDGHEGRHEQHLHLIFLRVKSDGKTVSDSWDSTVNRRTSRRIESELGLIVNAGAAESEKYNGSDRETQRQRRLEAEAAKPKSEPFTPEFVLSVVRKCRTPKQLVWHFAQAGIELNFRYRDEKNDGQKTGEREIYAWSLRRKDGGDWVAGNAIGDKGNQCGWWKIREILLQNAERQAQLRQRQDVEYGTEQCRKKRGHKSRQEGLWAKRPLQHGNRVDALASSAGHELSDLLQKLMGAGTSGGSVIEARNETPLAVQMLAEHRAIRPQQGPRQVQQVPGRNQQQQHRPKG